MTIGAILRFLGALGVVMFSVLPAPGSEVVQGNYRGWKSTALGNGVVRLQVVPVVGGRVMQFALGDAEFLWVNPQLAGKSPPPNGLGPGGTWLNYGGDKLWPAPQGWDNDQQWPGPPDGVLDGGPYECRAVQSAGQSAAIELKSRKDSKSGIQFARTIRIDDGSSHVGFDATMTNCDSKPRRWGIWSNTQLDAARRDAAGYNSTLVVSCPINPKSHFSKGYEVSFGARDNPSFQPDTARQMMRVQYLHRVGKIEMDSSAGWIATVNGQQGTAFVQQFTFQAERPYPDGSSVEFWTDGLGSFRAWGKENVMPNDPVANPYVLESEIISPFARLRPGESTTWHYDWYACRIGGNHAVVDCNRVGLTCERLTACRSGGQARLGGRFGVFYLGHAEASFLDRAGHVCGTGPRWPVSPAKPLVLSGSATAPLEAVTISVVLRDTAGNIRGELAQARIEP